MPASSTVRAARLQAAWRTRGLLASCLLPVAWLHGALLHLRRMLYRRGLLAVHTIAVPVVVVGNVVVGGAGKTPVLLALLDHLRARGIAAGVVSRGYGRQDSACREVQVDSDPAAVGDEPLLLRRRGGAPVFVAGRRHEAARALLAAHPGTRVILSDDGLQHLALARDIEVCVFDERGTGNGWLLPAGMLREPWPRQVDLVLGPPGLKVAPGAHGMRRSLAPAATRADGSSTALSALAARPVHAVAGIARPEAFFHMLEQSGLTLASCAARPDHASFEDFHAPADATLVCTEKDAVKLWRLRPDAWAVALQVQIDTGFWVAFDRMLDAKLSSAHGPETA